MNYKILSLLLILFLISGCYQNASFSPKIFDEVCRVQKPIIEDFQDAQNAYIDLFDAYEKNLKLLEILQSGQ